MPNLMDRTRGYAAYAVRRALGRSPDARVEEMERRVKELERLLAFQLRTYNGLTINNFATDVGLDHKKRHHFRSSDGKVILSQIPGAPYGVDFSVDEAELTLPDPGCPDALTRIRVPGGDIVEVDGCGQMIDFEGECIDITKTGPGEITFSRQGVTQILVNGVVCEDDCYTVNFIDEPSLTCGGICFEWEDSGDGGTCSIRARLNPVVSSQPSELAEKLWMSICDCEGNTWSWEAFREAPTP